MSLETFASGADNDRAAQEYSFEIAPELIATVEGYEKLSPDSRASVLLVLAGIKPAATISLPQQETVEKNLENHPDRAELEKLLTEIGVFYEETQGILLIAKSPGIVEELKRYWNAVEVNSKRIGSLLGYPPTSVEFFSRYVSCPTERPQTRLPADVEFSEAREFGSFILSPDHWREEFKTAQTWASAVKRLAPALFKEIIDVRGPAERLRVSNPEAFRQALRSMNDMDLIRVRDPEYYAMLVRERESAG